MQMKGKEKKVFSYDVEQLMLEPLAKGEPQAQGKAILNKEKLVASQIFRICSCPPIGGFLSRRKSIKICHFKSFADK